MDGQTSAWADGHKDIHTPENVYFHKTIGAKGSYVIQLKSFKIKARHAGSFLARKSLGAEGLL